MILRWLYFECSVKAGKRSHDLYIFIKIWFSTISNFVLRRSLRSPLSHTLAVALLLFSISHSIGYRATGNFEPCLVKEYLRNFVQSTADILPCLVHDMKSEEMYVMDKQRNFVLKIPHLLMDTQCFFNTLRTRQNGRHFTDDMLKCIFVKKMYEFQLEFHWSLFLRFQLKKDQH